MAELLSQSWLGWALVVIIGLPVATIVLTEVHSNLTRRRSAMAGPVHLLRSYLLPTAALLILLQQINTDILPAGGRAIKVVATVLGFLILMFFLSSLNAALFLNAAQGSWRSRMPSIFVDLGRILLIGLGLAVLFSWVWGADIGRLFAALGVTTIVLGLALQNAVGNIISGLLLLFEQPFRLGDWLETSSGRGRVVEVNWRAVHIEVPNGIRVVPNATLAQAEFINLSRPSVTCLHELETSFAETDAPLEVIDLLNEVAGSLAYTAPGTTPSTLLVGSGTYRTSMSLTTFADSDAATTQFRTRLWYAARRRHLALNGASSDPLDDTADVSAVLQRLAVALRLNAEQIRELAPRLDIERYAEGEIVERAGAVPRVLRYLVAGQVQLVIDLPRQPRVPVLTLREGDYLGQTALTRTPAQCTAIAAKRLTVLVVPGAVVDEMVRSDPGLARDLGAQIEQRRQAIEDALSRPGAASPEPIRAH